MRPFYRPVLSYSQATKIFVLAVLGALVTLGLLCRGWVSYASQASTIYQSYRATITSIRAPWQEWNGTRAAELAAHAAPVAEEAAYLNYLVDRYSLSQDIPWFARRIRPDYDAAGHGRPSLTRVGEPFVPHGFVKVHATLPDVADAAVDAGEDTGQEDMTALPPASLENTHLPIEPSLRLPMGRSARPGEIDASSLLFGISTTYARVAYANFTLAADWARWLTDGRGQSNGASLLLSLHQARAQQVDQISRVLAAHGIDARIHHAGKSKPKGRWRMGKNKDDEKEAAADTRGEKEAPELLEPETVRYANLIPLLQAYDREAIAVAAANIKSKAKGTASFENAQAQAAPVLANKDHDDNNNRDDAAADATPGTEPPPPPPESAAAAAAAAAPARRRARSHRLPDKRRSFYALVDDDVFFPSMDRLLSRLARYEGAYHPHISRADDLWIGFPSDADDWARVDAAGRTLDENHKRGQGEDDLEMTFGGGAVFLAPHLAGRIASLPCLHPSDDNNDSDTDAATAATGSKALHAIHAAVVAAGGTPPRWDEHLYRCASTHTPARMRVVPSLYTPTDRVLYGAATDQSQGPGSSHVARVQTYAGGRQPLTLHRYRWRGFAEALGHDAASTKNQKPQNTFHSQRHPPFAAGAAHRVTSVCGEDCFLQRFAFADGWVLVNGHSLTHYPPQRPQQPSSLAGGREGEPQMTSLKKVVDPLVGGGPAVGGGGGEQQQQQQQGRGSTQAKDLGGTGPEPRGLAGAMASFKDRLLGGLGTGPSTSPQGMSPEADRQERLRQLQRQHAFWAGQKLAVEERAEEQEGGLARMEEVSIGSGGEGADGASLTTKTWRLLDVRAAEDGSLWQAYVKRRPGGVYGEDEWYSSVDGAEEDSVIVLIWETQEE